MIFCKDIMALPSLRNLKLVSGKNGLNRILRWGHVLDMPDVLSWVQGGELLIMTGIAIAHDDEALKKIVEEIAARGLAGLIINIGPYISDVPPKVIETANSLDFPVFTLPWEVKLVRVIQEISNYIIAQQLEEKAVQSLLENILFSEFADYTLLASRVSQYGYKINQDYRVGILSIAYFNSSLQQQMNIDEAAMIHIKIQVKQLVEQILCTCGCSPLTLINMDSIIFLIPSRAERVQDDSSTSRIVDSIVKQVSHSFPQLSVRIGVGTAKSNLSDFKISLQQAKQILIFSENYKKKHSCFFEDLGLYKLLFKMDIKDLQCIYQETIGLLEAYDVAQGSELTRDLIGLLEANGNLNQAAEQLFLHRNTLRYRLQKIEEITGRSLALHTDRTTLQVGVMVGEILGLLPQIN
jgi:DNA-binding PucR family transcriptional regulator